MTSVTRPTLSNSTLLRHDLFIDGEWCPASDDSRVDVTDPASGETITAVAYATREDAQRAVTAAAAAFPTWAAMTAVDRASILRRWYELIVEHRDELAQILTSEMGKPVGEAVGEILYGAKFIEWFAEECKRVYGETIPTNVAGRRLFTLRQPIGVAAAITPWNFPMAMIARKVGPALAAGCTMVIKPATDTPLSALALAALGERAGIPRGVLNVVPGSGRVVGDELATNPTDPRPQLHRLHRGRQGTDGQVRRDRQEGGDGARRQCAGHRIRRCRSRNSSGRCNRFEVP